MKLLLKTILILTLAFSFGCSTNSERVDEESSAENTTEEALEGSPEEAALDEAMDETLDEAIEEGTSDQTPLALAGVEWTVEDIAGTAVVGETPATLIFGDDAKIAGHAGCNRFFGTYESTDSELKITTEGTTRMACPESIMDQEQAFLKTLNEVDSYQVDEEGVLTLSSGDSVVVTARGE